MPMGIAIGTGLGLGGGGRPAVYLLRDLFTTAEAAPLTSPRTCEPGPGTLTITDTGDLFSISGGKLQVALGGGAGDPALWGVGEITSAAGLVYLVTFTPTSGWFIFGWDIDTSYGLSAGTFRARSTTLDAAGSGGTVTNVASLSAGTEYATAIIVRETGLHYLIKGGAYSSWALLWVDDVTTGATLHPGIACSASGGAAFDNFRAAQCASPWDVTFGLPTDELAGALSGGETFTHPVDGRIEFDFDTLPSGGLFRVFCRWQDSDNFWELRAYPTGDTHLREHVDGGDAARASAAGALSGGERVIIHLNDETISVDVDGTEILSYGSAASLKTETNGQVNTLGTGGAASDLVTYPLDGDVPAPSGLFTDWLPGRREAGDTFSHAADCLLDYVIDALPSAGAVRLEFRQQDAENRWRVEADSAGNLDLIELVNDAPTTRASAGAGTLSGGERIVVIADDETINVYADGTLEASYGSAANFKAGTSGKIYTLGTAGVLSNLISWDRTLSGAARSALEVI